MTHRICWLPLASLIFRIGATFWVGLWRVWTGIALRRWRGIGRGVHLRTGRPVWTGIALRRWRGIGRGVHLRAGRPVWTGIALRRWRGIRRGVHLRTERPVWTVIALRRWRGVAGVHRTGRFVLT